MAFDYTNLYPDTSGNGGYTKSWNYTTVGDSIAVCSASGYFNKVATRVGIGDNIVVAVVDAFDKSRTALVESATLFVTGISGGVVTTVVSVVPIPASAVLTGTPTAPTAAPGTNNSQIATTAYADAIAALKASIVYVDAADALKAPLASPTFTGTLTAPTAALGTNTTQLATTAFVQASNPYFSASLSANQAISNNTATKINLNTELADSNSWYDNVTNFRFTPQLAGKYKVAGSFAITATTITEVDIYIYKNGSLYARQFSASSTVSALSLDIGNIVSFNGSTDYVELWCLAIGTGTINVLGSGGGISTWFEAQYVGV